MPINRALIDANDIRTWIAYNDTTGLIEPVRVDPVTGAVLIYIVGTTSVTPSSINHALHDANDSATQIGYDDTTGAPECMRCDTNGNLLIIAQ